MTVKGQEDAFPPTTLSNRSRLRKPTFAGTRGNEQDAPTTAIRRTADNRRGSILLGHSLFALERLFLPRRRRYGVSVQRGS
jgi:hypothetical protein